MHSFSLEIPCVGGRSCSELLLVASPLAASFGVGSVAGCSFLFSACFCLFYALVGCCGTMMLGLLVLCSVLLAWNRSWRIKFPSKWTWTACWSRRSTTCIGSSSPNCPVPSFCWPVGGAIFLFCHCQCGTRRMLSQLGITSAGRAPFKQVAAEVHPRQGSDS
jgi:hypothetical protein